MNFGKLPARCDNDANKLDLCEDVVNGTRKVKINGRISNQQDPDLWRQSQRERGKGYCRQR